MDTNPKFEPVVLSETQVEAFREEIESVWDALQEMVPPPKDLRALALYQGGAVMVEQLKNGMLRDIPKSVGILQYIGQSIYDSLERIENA